MTFRYSEVSRWGLGGSFLVSWMSLLVIQRSQGHFLGHLGAPELDFTDLGCVLGRLGSFRDCLGAGGAGTVQIQ